MNWHYNNGYVWDHIILNGCYIIAVIETAERNVFKWYDDAHCCILF